jgi:hypothetical protein
MRVDREKYSRELKTMLQKKYPNLSWNVHAAVQTQAASHASPKTQPAKYQVGGDNDKTVYVEGEQTKISSTHQEESNEITKFFIEYGKKEKQWHLRIFISYRGRTNKGGYLDLNRPTKLQLSEF